MTDIMLDLETMGNGPDAAIIAIGAVAFDLKTKTLGREFYQVVDLASSMAAGGTVTASTILWWMQQSDEARREFKQEGLDIGAALWSFRSWIYTLGPYPFDGCIWGNGADFDNVILRTAYERSDYKTSPWSHKHNRCFRTVRALYPSVDTSTWESVKHNALSDAKWQARYLCEVWARFVEGKG